MFTISHTHTGHIPFQIAIVIPTTLFLVFVVITSVVVFIIVLLKKAGLSQTCSIPNGINSFRSYSLLEQNLMLLLGYKRKNNNVLRPEGEIRNR